METRQRAMGRLGSGATLRVCSRLLGAKEVRAQKGDNFGVEVCMEGCSIEARRVNAEFGKGPLHCFGARRQEGEVNAIRDEMKLGHRWQSGTKAKSATPRDVTRGKLWVRTPQLNWRLDCLQAVSRKKD